MTDCFNSNVTNTEATDGTCGICNAPVYPGEARLTTLEYGLSHWECYEND